MLVVSSFYAALAGIMCVVLGILVIRQRRGARVAFGDGGHPVLSRATRIFGNFIEYAPLAMLLLALVEATGGRPVLVHILGAAFILGRLAHAIGLSQASGVNVGRSIGVVLTYLSILGSAITLLIHTVPRLF